jgi:pimeloyl-ACP methyl ester carboxylesterase
VQFRIGRVLSFRTFGVLRGTLPIALGVGLLATSEPTASQLSPYMHAQTLVDIGGRRMNLYCTGTGSPAVILDAGFGDTMESWYRVQRPISRTTRVCSYDRAGMGFSDGTPVKRNASAVVSDLHRLLRSAHIAPPYVLVGHSIAGLYVTLYADRFPSDVRGMVLVDPSVPFQVQRFAAKAPALVHLMAGQQTALHRCYDELSGKAPTTDERQACGFLTASGEAQICKDDGPALCAYARLQDAQAHRVLTQFDESGELDSIMAGARDVHDAQRSYGAMPLIVLTADDGPDHDRGFPANFPAVQVRALWNAWKTMHDEVAAHSSIGVNFVVRDTAHYIHQDQPAAVISAVDEVVAQARAHRSSTSR